MRIIWDDEKNRRLITERGVSFEEAATRILNGEILEVMKNNSRPGQFYFILILNEYTHVVPYIIGNNDEIILKTIFPSRKFHKKYGRKG